MAEVKYYLDENIAKSVLKGLRLRGVDAVSVTDVGMRTKKRYYNANNPKESRFFK